MNPSKKDSEIVLEKDPTAEEELGGLFKANKNQIIELDRTPTPEEELQEYLNTDEEREALQLKRFRKEIKLRGQYARRSWKLAKNWATFSGFITLLQFCKPFGWHLEQAEFIAIVATALATIIALYVQVGKGMFGKSS